MINLKKSCDYRLQLIAHKGDVWELNFQLQGRKINQNNQQKNQDYSENSATWKSLQEKQNQANGKNKKIKKSAVIN